MKKIVLFLLILSFSFSFQSVYTQTSRDTLSQKLEKICKENNVPGFAVAVVSKDKIIYQNSFGYSDIANQKPYSTSTIQNIGSTSKTFIGVAIMKLVEEKKLTLDTKINDILPFKVIHSKYPDIPITVRHLGNHTSGIEDTNGFYLNDYVPTNPQKGDAKGFGFWQKIQWNRLKKNKHLSLSKFLQEYLLPNGSFYSKKNFKTKPGESYSYSNAGAALGALVVETIVGMPFEDYTRKVIFNPLNMNETAWSFDKIDMEKHAILYYPKKMAMIPNYTLNTFPDGGLLTNVNNLTLYLQEMMRGYAGESDILNLASFQEMMRNQITEVSNKEPKLGYGIFWDVGKTAKGHNGSDPGANSLMYFFPEENIGVLFIVNMSLDDSKKTIPVYQNIWSSLRKYTKGIEEEEK